MTRLMTSALLGILLLCSTPWGCSEQEEAKHEKGKIEQMTDEAAEAVVRKIRTPMDRAHSVKDKEKERARAMDEAIEETMR